MDTKISPTYPKSWPTGVFKKAFSEGSEKSSRL